MPRATVVGLAWALAGAVLAVAPDRIEAQAQEQGHEGSRTAEAAAAAVDTAAADTAATPASAAPSLESLGGTGEEGALQRLRGQILQNPIPLDQAWLSGFCQYIPNADSLAQYLNGLARAGAVFDSTHATAIARDERDGQQNPRFFLEKSKTALLAKKVSLKRVEGRGRGFVNLALYRAFRRGHYDWLKVDPAFMKEFYKVNNLLYQVLETATPDTSAEQQARWADQVRAREAALIDAYERLLRHRERLAELGVGDTTAAGGKKEKRPQERLDALIGRLDTQPWRTKWETPRGVGQRPTAYAEYLEKAIDENLMALGRIFSQAVATEKESEERQQDLAARAGEAFAMVYRRSQPVEALRQMRGIERVQQDFMRQRARANWESARKAADGGQDELAAGYYYQATHDFLQCLARLVGQDQKEATEEFLQMREEIAAWKARRPLPSTGGRR